MGSFFISIEFTRDAMVLDYVFPSPLGIFFISIKLEETKQQKVTWFPSLWGAFLFLLMSGLLQ